MARIGVSDPPGAAYTDAMRACRPRGPESRTAVLREPDACKPATGPWWLVLVLFAAACGNIQALESPVAIRGTVVEVRDGDTLQMLTQTGERIEVRLNAIDAPEKAHGRVRGQPHAERARISLTELSARRSATLLRTTMDRYGRHVGMLIVETALGEIDAGWWQLHAGYAWVFERYVKEIPPAQRLRYREAQDAARAQGRGLWADPHPVAPWEWRRRQPDP